MAEKVSVKGNAPQLLEKKLAYLARHNRYGIILLGSSTDPYLHFEENTALTKTLLEIILHYRFPVHIVTRSNLITRDIALIKKINEDAQLPEELKNSLKHKAVVTFSFSTLDSATAKIFEPGAPSPALRLETMKKFVKEDIMTGVSMLPMLPYITDTGENLELMVKTFKEAGVHYIFPATLTLFGEGASDSKPLVFNSISKYYPHLKEKYEKLFRDDYQLPGYYRKAFEIKMESLFTKYNIKNRII